MRKLYMFEEILHENNSYCILWWTQAKLTSGAYQGFSNNLTFPYLGKACKLSSVGFLLG